MNCCENNQNDNEKTNHSQHNHQGHGMKHMLMMALCCGLPVILLLVLPLLGALGTNVKATIGWIVPFLCPLMMIFMMPMMFKSAKEDKPCCKEEEETKEVKES